MVSDNTAPAAREAEVLAILRAVASDTGLLCHQSAAFQLPDAWWCPFCGKAVADDAPVSVFPHTEDCLSRRARALLADDAPDDATVGGVAEERR